MCGVNIRLLKDKPEVILLDEPTNHLDEESKVFIDNIKHIVYNVIVLSK